MYRKGEFKCQGWSSFCCSFCCLCIQRFSRFLQKRRLLTANWKYTYPILTLYIICSSVDGQRFEHVARSSKTAVPPMIVVDSQYGLSKFTICIANSLRFSMKVQGCRYHLWCMSKLFMYLFGVCLLLYMYTPSSQPVHCLISIILLSIVYEPH